jgi:hypothetical protein
VSCGVYACCQGLCKNHAAPAHPRAMFYTVPQNHDDLLFPWFITPTPIKENSQLTAFTLRLGWTIRQCTTPKIAGLPADVSSVPEPLTMGYGFDDGPNCTHNAFYSYLASQNQKATMYYIGSNVLDWPLEAQRALADGHEICARTCWSLGIIHARIGINYCCYVIDRHLVTSLQ